MKGQEIVLFVFMVIMIGILKFAKNHTNVSIILKKYDFSSIIKF